MCGLGWGHLRSAVLPSPKCLRKTAPEAKTESVWIGKAQGKGTVGKIMNVFQPANASWLKTSSRTFIFEPFLKSVGPRGLFCYGLEDQLIFGIANSCAWSADVEVTALSLISMGVMLSMGNAEIVATFEEEHALFWVDDCGTAWPGNLGLQKHLQLSPEISRKSTEHKGVCSVCGCLAG